MYIAFLHSQVSEKERIIYACWLFYFSQFSNFQPSVFYKWLEMKIVLFSAQSKTKIPCYIFCKAMGY